MPERDRRKSVLLDLKGKRRDELVTLKVEIGVDLDAIRAQLDRAKQTFRQTGRRASEDWLRRVRGAARVKGRQIEQICARVTELGARTKKHVPHVFMKHAELLLPSTDFKRILEAALKECDVSQPISGEELEKDDLT